MRKIPTVFGEEEVRPCQFCGQADETQLHVPNVGIAFGMAGEDHSFCVDCLKWMTAYEFWDRLCRIRLGQKLPLRLKGFTAPLPKGDSCT
jgi:hypothetical protein